MGMNGFLSLELYTAFIGNKSAVHIVATMFKFDRASIDVILQRYQRVFYYFSKNSDEIRLHSMKNILELCVHFYFVA